MFENLNKMLNDLNGVNVLVTRKGNFFASYDIGEHMDFEQLLATVWLLAQYEQDPEMSFEIRL